MALSLNGTFPHSVPPLLPPLLSTLHLLPPFHPLLLPFHSFHSFQTIPLLLPLPLLLAPSNTPSSITSHLLLLTSPPVPSITPSITPSIPSCRSIRSPCYLLRPYRSSYSYLCSYPILYSSSILLLF